MALAQLRTLIRDATRTAFTDLQAQHPDESFYVFALQSLDDASGVYAAANTDAGYRQCTARYADRASPPGERYCRWYWGEWEYKSVRRDLFRGVYDFINRENRNFQGADLWLSFKATVFASMVLALHDLDGEGIFGSGEVREQITLLCTVEDSYSTEWVEEESAHLLNSPAVYRAFSVPRDAVAVRKAPLHPHFQRMRDEFVRILYE